MNSKKKHIIILEVENQPGVLTKIASLCRRKQYNIQSLTVGTTNKPGLSHMTIVVYENIERIQQVMNQMKKIIEVIKVEHAYSKDVIDKEMVLLVMKNKEAADKLIDITASLHNASLNTMMMCNDHPVIEMVGSGTEIEHILENLDMQKDVVKMARSGLVALTI